ncbi:MAG: hypothetical protein M1829_002626 [Trizodia sp. TS-e1964]|nr:MAG: hypothetical protein M1829_002626 [Trizodia sp. TS-e1964]
MSSQAPLEGLPLELLEKIFIESKNCDLPLCSRSLLHLLSSPHLPRLMAHNILSSNNAPAQTQLLARRLFTPALFDSLSREITPPCTDSYYCTNGFLIYLFPPASPTDPAPPAPAPPHFVLAPDVRLCPRLLCGKQAHQSTDQYRASASTRLDLLARLNAGGAYDCERFNNMRAFAQGEQLQARLRALQDALDARLPDVVEYFMSNLPCKLPAEMLKAALMSPSHDFRTLGYLLSMMGWEHEVMRDKELRAWVAKRVRDERSMRRVMKREGRTGALAQQALWKGDWLEAILYRGERRKDYFGFMMSRRQPVSMNVLDESDQSRLGSVGGGG